MLGIRALGVPSHQELLLFDDFVVAHPRLGPSQTQRELDYLEDQKVIRRIDLASLLITPENQLDRRIISEAQARTIVAECGLLRGEKTPLEMLEHIFLSDIEAERRHQPGWDYVVDHPGTDTYYNDKTRLIAAVMHHVYAAEAVGILQEDRSAVLGYSGYRSRMPFSPRGMHELPESLRRLLEGEAMFHGLDVGPQTWSSGAAEELARAEQIYDVLLTQMPVPVQATPWDDLLEFRRETATRLQFMDLHRWVRKMVREDLSVRETIEELEYLLLSYENHLNTHRVRFRYGKLRLLLSFGAGVVENSLKFKLKELVDLPFQFAERVAALKDADARAPGREISYIVRARERFGDGHALQDAPRS
jgi:hypothetical protein